VYVICVHFVMLLLPGLCGRALYCWIPLPRFLGSQNHAYAAALTQRLCNSANLRTYVPLLLQGTMVPNSHVVDTAVQEKYTILFQRTLGGLEHLLVGYAVLIVAGVLVCYIGNRGKDNGTNSVDQSLQSARQQTLRQTRRINERAATTWCVQSSAWLSPSPYRSWCGA
jgi:hypothetical protein